jgi:hypothetical protein
MESVVQDEWRYDKENAVRLFKAAFRLDLDAFEP